MKNKTKVTLAIYVIMGAVMSAGGLSPSQWIWWALILVVAILEVSQNYEYKDDQ